MRLIDARVFNYKCITDSNSVTFEDVTCLVGKNESGKTAFLQALSKLSPYVGSNKFDAVKEFPRSRYIRDYKKKQKHDEGFKERVVTATFSLDDDEFERLEDDYGKGVLKSKEFTVTKYYEDANRFCSVEIDESKAIQHFIAENKGDLENVYDEVKDLKTLDNLKAKLENLEEVKEIATKLAEIYPKTISDAIRSELSIPKFFYFDEYSIMSGEVKIDRIELPDDQITEGERAFKKFLEFAGITVDELKNKEDYEASKATIESASNDITSQIFEYWRQNSNLSVELDRTEAFATDKSTSATQPEQRDSDLIRVRIKNNKHGVTVNFDNRSRGFVWFFSFLIYFSQIEDSEGQIILILDEPGLNLHAKAQEDFLRFIDEKLSEKYQVIYSTHSPFMIPTQKWHTVRTVEDIDNTGTKISPDALKNSVDTVFPLQGALGYDLAQTLFVGENCLLVEGPSDLIYLQLINEILDEEGKTTLDPKWVITPVGGADKISSFIALLGANNLNIAVLLDFSKAEKQKIENLKKKGFLNEKKLILLSQYNDNKDTDIEDLLGEDIYLKIINDCYKDKIKKHLHISDLTRRSRIVKRIEKYFFDNELGRFNHYTPALYMQREFGDYKDDLKNKLDSFEGIFSELNQLIKPRCQ